MYKSLIFSITAFMLLAALTIGCSGGSKENPVIPSDSKPASEPEPTAYIPDDLPDGFTAPMLFGIYEVEIDPLNLTGKVHPVRISDVLGESYHVDITPFLTISPCSDCLDIKSIALNEDLNLEVTFRTKHPFEPTKRYDLHVFDMRGIIVSGVNIKDFSRIRLDMDGDGTRETTARATIDFLLNPDGYTSFYDGVVEQYLGKIYDGNINPYKNLWFCPKTSQPGSNYDPAAAPQYGFTDLTKPTGHNVFPMGGNFDNPLSETIYELKFSDTVRNVNFMLILEASYGHTTRMKTRLQPRYFLPEFHRKDAWWVTADLISNDLIGWQSTSSAKLAIRAYDWQAGIAPTPGWDYQTSSLTSIKYASDIKEVIIDIPGILSGSIVTTLAQTQGGDGSPMSPYTWEIDFTNQLAADPGTYWGLVAVRDALEGTPNAPLATSGSAMTPKRLNDLTTYQVFEVLVEEGNLPPVADVLVNPDPVRVCKDVTISVGPDCLDPDGTIVMYEYDTDYSGNPATFVPIFTQNEGDGNFGDPVIWQFDQTQTGNHRIGQRVTDNLGSTSIDSENVQVNANAAPTAVLQDSDADNEVDHNEIVTFQPGAGTGDPDGFITKYEYDFDYSGTFIADETQNQGDGDFGDPVDYQFTNPGSTDINITVAFRVTDDGCPYTTSPVVSTTFKVHPFITLYIYEDFESTTTHGSVPTNWGVIGRYGQGYYLNTCNTGCNNDTYHWGITHNDPQCDSGEHHFLNEIGYAYPNSDYYESFQTRATIVFTPEFIVPINGATITIRHWFDMCWSNMMGTSYLDGGAVILSENNPGSIQWSDFCNALTWEPADCTNVYYGNNWPIRTLSPTSPPSYGAVSSLTSPAHPLNGRPAHVGSNGWATTTYSIPNTYAGELVRVGFLFGSDDLLPRSLPLDPYRSDCTQYDDLWNSNVFPGYGWRINWVKIESN